jgi:hypothetical protein
MILNAVRLSKSARGSPSISLKGSHRSHLPALAFLVLSLANTGADDLKIGDFRGANYGDWKTTGTAFRQGPARGDLLTKLGIENSTDGAVASSEVDGDGPIGTLTSPEFKIARPFIAFRISGGEYEHRTCLNLLVRSQVVRSATGWRSDLRGVRLVLTSGKLELENRSSTVADRIRTLEILFDRTSIEAFVNAGEVSLTKFVLPNENGLSLKAEGAAVTIHSLVIWPLNSAWPDGVPSGF